VTIRFYKYHGTGNDFILIDNRDGQFIADKEDIEHLCDRRFGIGADGLITFNDADGFDFGMRYYNSDGRESSMCGNGGRCVVAFADYLSLPGETLMFSAADGVHTGRILSHEGNACMVSLSMNIVKGYTNTGDDLFLDTGSPHLVRFVPEADNIDVCREGRALRNMPEYQPEGTNVNFVEAGNGEIYVRTYERGVEDETLSCGTGVTASSLAYAATRGLTDGTIHVRTKGGRLKLSFKRTGEVFSEIFLEGPAVKVFDGRIVLRK
jgi:diaminopimelate epimerase